MARSPTKHRAKSAEAQIPAPDAGFVLGCSDPNLAAVDAIESLQSLSMHDIDRGATDSVFSAFGVSRPEAGNSDASAGLRRKAELYEGLRVEWQDAGTSTDSQLFSALGLYYLYPIHYEAIELDALAAHGERWRIDDDASAARHAFDALKRANEASARLLLGIAVRLRIDGSPISVSARICRKLFDRHGLKCIQEGYDRFATWPDCLGMLEFEFSANDRQKIDDGYAAFELLLVTLRIERSELIPVRPISASTAVAGATNLACTAPRPRVEVDVEHLTVTIDGTVEQLNSHTEARMLKVLADNRGQILSSRDLEKLDRELAGRPGRVRDGMPIAARRLIETVCKKGFRMRMQVGG